MLSWLKPSPLLEQQEQQWLIDTFLWAYTHFDHVYFNQHTQLVLPSNDFFPGQSHSVAQMAEQIFTQVKHYSGMAQWPIELVSPYHASAQTFVPFAIEGALRGNRFSLSEPASTLFISYNPQQINQPQDLIASFAQAFARILIYQQGQLPPGGKEYLDSAVELVASFLGFGVMLSNTVYQFRGSCAKCHNPYAHRSSELSEAQQVFLLALFCRIKGIKTAPKALKGHLKSYYKKAQKHCDELVKHSANPMLLSLLEPAKS